VVPITLASTTRSKVVRMGFDVGAVQQACPTKSQQRGEMIREKSR